MPEEASMAEGIGHTPGRPRLSLAFTSYPTCEQKTQWGRLTITASKPDGTASPSPILKDTR